MLKDAKMIDEDTCTYQTLDGDRKDKRQQTFNSTSSVDHIPDSQPADRIGGAKRQMLFSGFSEIGLSFAENGHFDSDFVGAATDDTARRIIG